MITNNRMLEKLRSGGTAIGTQLRSRSPMVAELFGYLGFDFVYIESEHFPFNIETVEELVRGCDLAGITSLIRIPDHDEGKILQFLDMGIGGLILPHVENREEALSIVKAGKYSPVGERGYSDTSRSAQYGMIPVKEYRELSNRNTALIPMIESRQAAEHLEDILNTGIDLIRIGLRDLSDSFGYGGEQNHSDLQKAVDQIIATADKYHIAVGCAAGSLEDAREKLGRGFRQISFKSDMAMIRSASAEALEQLRCLVK